MKNKKNEILKHESNKIYEVSDADNYKTLMNEVKI